MIAAMAEEKKAGPLAVIKAVLWSFLGIRRGAEHEADMRRLKPVHVLVAGVIAAAVFILTIITVVRVVLHLAGT